MKVVSTIDFNNWYKKTTLREKAQVDARIARIEEFDHLGDWKYIGKSLLELRWKNGRRVYFARLKDESMLLITGGYKNEQKKSIKKAYKILERYTGFETQE